MYLKRSIGFFADAASVLGQLQALRTLHGGSSCDSVTAAAASQAKARNRPVFSTGRFSPPCIDHHCLTTVHCCCAHFGIHARNTNHNNQLLAL